MRRIKWILTVAVVLLLAAGLVWANRWAALSAVIESDGLAEPFVGLTDDGIVDPGLFSLSPAPDNPKLRAAARHYLDSLSPDQRAHTQFAVTDDEWRKWMNVHFYIRQGLRLRDATTAQSDAFFDVLRHGLSESGFILATDIMKLDTTLAEITDNFDEYGEDLFHLTIMGEPHRTEPWGWQLDGHHLVLNSFTIDGQVVMSPLFLGAEPAVARQGKHTGTAVLQDVQDLGLRLFQSLEKAQQDKSRISTEKTDNHAEAEFFSDNAIVPIAGIAADDLLDGQRQELVALVRRFLALMPSTSAALKMQEVLDHLPDTHFAWIGGHRDNDAFYYRIQSPVIYIEFDHQKPVGIRHIVDSSAPHRDHVHAVIRTPNGNDYGKQLLAEHLSRHPH